jgi:hypothetical protein
LYPAKSEESYGVEIPVLAQACRQITADLRQSLGFLRSHAVADDRLYAIVLACRDGLDYTMLYWGYHKPLGDRQKRRAATDYAGLMADKWYFGNMIDAADEVDDRRLQAAIPLEPVFTSPDYCGLRGALILWSLAGSLRELAAAGEMEHRGRPVVGFCSLVDSADAGWVERETARYINSPEAFAAFEPEHLAYRGSCGAEPTAGPLREFFDRLGTGG